MNSISRYASFLCTLCLMVVASASLCAQTRVGYVASQVIRERFGEAQQANQRIENIVNEWKKELEQKQTTIDELQAEIRKKRLIWGDEERKNKESSLETLRSERESFAKQKFGPDGAFDKMVADMYKPIEEKIFAAIQDVANSEGYDIVWDKSTQPLVYVNPRYDITVKVMERLGIPVEDLKVQQQEAIDNDPRNAKEKTTSKRRRSRSRNNDGQTKDDEGTQQPDQQPEHQEIPIPR